MTFAGSDPIPVESRWRPLWTRSIARVLTRRAAFPKIPLSSVNSASGSACVSLTVSATPPSSSCYRLRMPSFSLLYLRTFVQPRRAFESVLMEPKRVRFGLYAVAITAFVYFLVYFFLSQNGGRPTVFRPWLAIPAEVYYRYNLYFVVPSIALSWISATGFAHLVARALGGTGSYEDTLAVLGFGLSISSWWTGLHDLVTTFLGYAGLIDQRAYEDAMSTPTPFRTMLWVLMIGYAAWFILTFTKGIGAAHRLRVKSAAVSGIVGFVVYQFVFVVFNR